MLVSFTSQLKLCKPLLKQATVFQVIGTNNLKQVEIFLFVTKEKYHFVFSFSFTVWAIKGHLSKRYLEYVCLKMQILFTGLCKFLLDRCEDVKCPLRTEKVLHQ